MPPPSHPHFCAPLPPPPLMPFHFLKIQVSVLHLLVNLGDCNIRIKDLTDKAVFSILFSSSPESFPPCLFPSHCLARPHAEPHLIQCLDHSDRPLCPPSLFTAQLLYIHCKHSPNLFSHSTYTFFYFFLLSLAPSL